MQTRFLHETAYEASRAIKDAFNTLLDGLMEVRSFVPEENPKDHKSNATCEASIANQTGDPVALAETFDPHPDTRSTAEKEAARHKMAHVFSLQNTGERDVLSQVMQACIINKDPKIRRFVKTLLAKYDVAVNSPYKLNKEKAIRVSSQSEVKVTGSNRKLKRSSVVE